MTCIKKCDLHVIGIPEGKELARKIFEEILLKFFQVAFKNSNTQVQEYQ